VTHKTRTTFVLSDSPGDVHVVEVTRRDDEDEPYAIDINGYVVYATAEDIDALGSFFFGALD
jgi:hypothetical protein